MSNPQEPWQTPARLRAGDGERQQAIEILTRAWREGRISRAEFQERSQQALGVVHTDELAALLSDVGGWPFAPSGSVDQSTRLPVLPPSAEPAIRDAWQADQDANLPARIAPEGTPGTSISIGVMSGVDRVGEWVVAPTHVAVGFWGGATIDLRDAVFTSPETTITCIGVMGGVEVIVPPDMDVRVNGFGFMGGFGWEKLDQARPAVPPAPGSPRVTINGLGFWGGVGVVRRARGEAIN